MVGSYTKGGGGGIVVPKIKNTKKGEKKEKEKCRQEGWVDRYYTSVGAASQ